MLGALIQDFEASEPVAKPDTSTLDGIRIVGALNEMHELVALVDARSQFLDTQKCESIISVADHGPVDQSELGIEYEIGCHKMIMAEAQECSAKQRSRPRLLTDETFADNHEAADVSAIRSHR